MTAKTPENPLEQSFDRALAGAVEEHREQRQLSPDAALRRAQHMLSGDGSAAAMSEPSVDLVDALIERAQVLTGEDASEAVLASSLAVKFARRLDGTSVLHHIVEVRALTSLLSTARSAAAFEVAHLAEAEVLDLLNYGAFTTPDLENDALLAIGRLYVREGAYHETLFFAEDALEVAEVVADRERTVDSLRLLGVASLGLQNYDRARDLFWRAHDTTQDPRTLFVCCQNLAYAYCGLHHYRAAHEMLDQATDLSSNVDRPQDALRLLWTRAHAYAGAGDGGKAVETLETVIEGFLHLQRPQAFGESVLELALLLLERAGTVAAARGAALLAAECFETLGLTHQSIAARAIVSSAQTSSALRRGLEALKASVTR